MSNLGVVLVLVVLLHSSLGAMGFDDDYSRSDFPPDFIFGSGTTAYQVEGAAMEDGRTPSIWDTFAHSDKESGGNGDIACDEYHKYKEDVELMADVGLDAYRFSISWSRLIPNGRGPINPKGLEYYNNLINELISKGIQPHVTLHNFDLPQVLEDEYEGWISPKIIEDFTMYAEVCFKEFGDRVLHWATINEPNVFAMGRYDLGILPPQRCSYPFGETNCTKGNSSIEPYLVVHHCLLAHASAVNLYKNNYKDEQHGFVGMTIYLHRFVPFTETKEDAKAVERAYEFLVNWVLHWATINEPNVFVIGGYDSGLYPPQRCSYPFGGVNCSKGNSSTEPYLVVHHCLLAHASAANLYKINYKDKQHGFVGMSIYMPRFVPFTESKEDANAVERAYEFLVNWVLHPLVFGEYPKLMKKVVGSRLPIFTNDESNLVKGSADFIGIIHYQDWFIKDDLHSLMMETRDFVADMGAKTIILWENFTTAESLRVTIEYLKEVYGNPPIYVYENGFPMKRTSLLEDVPRVEYMHGYIGAVLDALRNGSNVKGYFTWSFLDVFELLDEYQSSYGLFYVDINDPKLKRYPKLSAQWFSNFLKGKVTILKEVLELNTNPTFFPSQIVS